MPTLKKKAKKVEKKKEAKKPAKKVAAKKVAPKKEEKPKKITRHPAPRKAAVKITPKKANAKPKNGVVEKKSKKKNVKILEPVKETTGKRVYHVSKRPDGKWAVKFAGGEKAVKLFKTQAEAVDYTKKMASNQGGAMLVHNSKGKNKGRIQ